MTRVNLPTASAEQIGQFNPTVVADLVTKLAEHDSALDTIGAPSSGTATATVTSGAVAPLTSLTWLSVTGTVAFSLADGVVAGQTVTLECTVAATTPKGTLTITTPISGEPATHVFNAVGQRLTLKWNGSAWYVTAKKRAGSTTAVVGTTVLTGYDMNSIYDLSITGTVTSTTTMALPDPMTIDDGFVVSITCSTAATCPAGTLDGSYLTTGNAAATHLAVNATTDTALFAASGKKWRAILLTSTTLS